MTTITATEKSFKTRYQESKSTAVWKIICRREELHVQQQLWVVELWSRTGLGVNPTACPLIYCVMAGIVPNFSEPLFSHL